MDYNINFKYKSGGGTASSGMGAIAGRNKAIQASQKQAGAGQTLRPDTSSSKRLIDSNVKLSTNILKLNQSITLLTAAVRKGGGVGGGRPAPAGGPTGGGGSGLGSVGAAAGYLGIPIALAGFAASKISQVGNAYIEKVSQQKGSVGIGGFRTQRKGAYMAPEVSGAIKAHRMAAGTFGGNVDPMAFKFGTVFGQSAEQAGRESGTMARYGGDYGRAIKTGAGSGIQTDLPKFMSAIAGEMEEAVKRGVNSSDLADDIGGNLASITSNTQTKSVEMAMSIVGKTRGTKEAAARGQISGIDSLMTWKAGESKLMQQFGSEDRGKMLEQLQKKGLITAEETKKLGTGKVSAESIRQTIGQGGYTSLVRDKIESMSGPESARRSMMETQKTWGSGVKGFRRWNAMNPGMGGNLSQSEGLALFQSAKDPRKFEEQFKKNATIDNMFKKTEDSAPMLGVKRQQQLDDLLYKRGNNFAKASFKMEKAMIKLADTLSGTVLDALNKVSKMGGGRTKSVSKSADEADRMFQ